MFTLLYFLMFVDCAHMNTHPNLMLKLFLLAVCARRTHSCQILWIFFACLFCELTTSSSSSTSWQTWFIVSSKLQTVHPINKRSQNKSNFTHLLLFLFCEAFVPRLKLCTVLNCS